MCKIWPDKTLMSPSAKEDGSEERWNKKNEGHEGKKWAFSMKGTECQRWRTSGEESERSDVVGVVVVVLQNPHGLMILDGKMKTGDWGLNPLCRKCWGKKNKTSALSPQETKTVVVPRGGRQVLMRVDSHVHLISVSAPCLRFSKRCNRGWQILSFRRC